MQKSAADLRHIIEPTADTVRLSLQGRLDVHSVGVVWADALAALARRPALVAVDTSGLSYCDGGGIALFLELQRRQEENGGRFVMERASPEVDRLYRRFSQVSGRTAPLVRDHRGFFELVGASVVTTWTDIVRQVRFLGEMLAAFGTVLRRPRLLRVSDTIRAVEDVGATAVPLIMLLGFVIGLIMALQSALQLRWYGADLLVANVVGLSMVRELGPMMTGIILTGRSASAFAAELGAMKVNEEINALTTMGIDPIRFLAVPRLLAALFVTPLLTMFMVLAGLLGGGLVMMSMGFPPVTYINQLLAAIKLSDLMGGLARALTFGILVAAAGCQNGFTAGDGARAVGTATTNAVVAGIILIILADGIFAALSYVFNL